MPVCVIVAQFCLTVTPWTASHQRIPCRVQEFQEIPWNSLQARVLEWVAIPFFMEFPNPGIKPESIALKADYCLSHQGSTSAHD